MTTLVAAIIVLVITVAGFFLVISADMMSDAPDANISPWPWTIGGLCLSVALFAAWWFWGGVAMTW